MNLRVFPLLMLFIALTPVLGEESLLGEIDDYWTNHHHIQDGWMSGDPLGGILLRRTRKPRPHQFIGLMGKRSMAKTQIPRKRHKVNSFVGLMGKRNQEEPDSYDWSAIQMYDKRR
ncbi:protachykinin-1 isoform X1 [Phyllopteryx taeniolatus]|uniref:protachykinin-1 isoform X1 n=1 Tax=Phyllopteryx taeniolatus TaxID=161469 RepID=UPI002AD1F138|nr:protachykinin-1 isoform X1 [Phyllopteryx taeniolatus]